MQQNDKLLNYAFKGYAISQIANYLMGFMGSIVNGIVISRFMGMEFMAAFQLVLPITMLTSVIGILFSTGLQSACSGCLGSGNLDDAKSYYTVTLIGLVPIGLLFALVAGLFAGSLATALGATGDNAYLAEEASRYLVGIAPSLAITTFMPIITSVLFLEGQGMVSMISIVCQLVISVAGSFIVAFCLPSWGLLGMGLVASLSGLVGLIVLMIGKLRSKGSINLTRSGLSFSKFWSVLTIGLPSALDRLYKTAQTMVVNILLLAVATGTSVAAFGVLSQAANIAMPFIMGITGTALTMAGVFYGERDKSGLVRLFGITFRWSEIAGVLITIVVTLTAPLLVMLFKSPEDPTFAAAVHALRIYIWSYPFYSFCKFLQDYYLGSKANKMTYIISTVENLILVIASVVVLGKLYGEDGVWWGFVIGEVLAVICTLIIITVMKKRFPRKAEDFMFLPQLYDKVQETACEWSAANADEVKEISADAKAYMLELGEKEEKADLLSRFVEEMGKIITQWAQDGGAKGYYADIRVVGIPILDEEGNPKEKEIDRWTLRVRDNNKHFDLEKWQEVHSDEPKTRPAIHSVDEQAKESSYSYTMSMNYLIVTV